MLTKKLLSFLSLLLIQLIVSIIYKYSQKRGKYEYSPLAIIACAEAIKFLISLSLFIYHLYHLNQLKNFIEIILNELRNQLFLLNTFVLSLFYCLNNQLSFILFLSVDPASISLFKSLSSLECAILLWLFSSRQINEIQWGSICLQVIGLIIVQYDSCEHNSLFSIQYYFLLIGSSLITALSTVLNEHLIQTYNVNINLQNLFLYLFGFSLNFFLFYFFPNLISNEKKGFFQGYSWIVILIIICNSILGIVITFVYKYADAIIKTFSTACATGVLLIFNITLFHSHTNLTSFLGATVIFIASYIYFSSSPPLPQNLCNDSSKMTLDNESEINSSILSTKSKVLFKWIFYLLIIIILIISFLYILMPTQRFHFLRFSLETNLSNKH